MTPPLCNCAMRRADERFFCSTERLLPLDLVCLFVCVCENPWMHRLTPPVHSNIQSDCLNVFRPSSINKSMNLNSLTVLSPPVMQQRFAVIAAFSYAAVFDLMKNVNRQAGYVTQCRVSGGLVIGLKTEPHWQCHLTQTCSVCLKQRHMFQNLKAFIIRHLMFVFCMTAYVSSMYIYLYIYSICLACSHLF